MEIVKDKVREIYKVIDDLRCDLNKQSFDLQNLKVLLNYFFQDYKK